MDKGKEAEKIIRKHVLWSMGAGLMPIPLLDIAAVTAVQIDMLKQLTTLYDVDYSGSKGKAFVAALTSSTFARIGASMIKSFPGVGSLVGGMSMSALSGASTYGVGKVATNMFSAGGDLESPDLEAAQKAYEDTFEQGKRFVSNLGRRGEQTRDVFQDLERPRRPEGRGSHHRRGVRDAEAEAP